MYTFAEKRKTHKPIYTPVVTHFYQPCITEIADDEYTRVMRRTRTLLAESQNFSENGPRYGAHETKVLLMKAAFYDDGRHLGSELCTGQRTPGVRLTGSAG